jgi:hypothetical protein
MPGNAGGISFNYKKIDGFLRPIIRAEVCAARNKDGVPCAVLVDSGADFCIFKYEIGEILGLNVRSGDRIKFKGINGAVSTGYAHKVWLGLKGRAIKLPVVFTSAIKKGNLQVVGQLGFFEQFKVNFDYQKQTVVLRVR